MREPMRQTSNAVVASASELVAGSFKQVAVNARTSQLSSVVFPTSTCSSIAHSIRSTQSSLHLFNVIAHALHMQAQHASFDVDDQLAVVQSPLNASGVRVGPASGAGAPPSPSLFGEGVSLPQATRCMDERRVSHTAAYFMSSAYHGGGPRTLAVRGGCCLFEKSGAASRFDNAGPPGSSTCGGIVGNRHLRHRANALEGRSKEASARKSEALTPREGLPLYEDKSIDSALLVKSERTDAIANWLLSLPKDVVGRVLSRGIESPASRNFPASLGSSEADDAEGSLLPKKIRRPPPDPTSLETGIGKLRDFYAIVRRNRCAVLAVRFRG